MLLHRNNCDINILVKRQHIETDIYFDWTYFIISLFVTLIDR